MERDIDLANGRFDIGRDKTAAGMREVDTLPLLRDVLAEYRAQKLAEGLPTGPNDPVLLTSTSRPRDRHNLRKLLATVVKRAEEMMAERGGRPLPQGITPHKLRHTYASILTALGRDPVYIMNQLGHTDPAFTLRVYAHMMRRSPQERERLKALVEGHRCAPNQTARRAQRTGASRTASPHTEVVAVLRAARAFGVSDRTSVMPRPSRRSRPKC